MELLVKLIGLFGVLGAVAALIPKVRRHFLGDPPSYDS